jgi:hypothetical protein
LEVNIAKKREKRRLSIITDIIIFLLLLNVFLFGVKIITSNSDIVQNLSLEDVEISNKNYIESKYIKEKYNIDILYGKASHEAALKVDGSIQENEYTIYENIEEIKKTLAKYPDSFFVNNNLTIILLDNFNNNNIALASKNKLNEFKIYIRNNDTFERSLHHEMFHIFEYRLNMTANNVFSNWNNFNPQNFVYLSSLQTLDDKYIYNHLTNQDETYFVSKYSKTSEKEDRAEIFAEIMSYKIRPEYLTLESNIGKKAELITTVMTQKLEDSNNATFYWNRF